MMAAATAAVAGAAAATVGGSGSAVVAPAAPLMRAQPGLSLGRMARLTKQDKAVPSKAELTAWKAGVLKFTVGLTAHKGETEALSFPQRA
eukprot:SAG11_NODE_85_length_17370_cov_29.272017_15_plen_90_part_00